MQLHIRRDDVSESHAVLVVIGSLDLTSRQQFTDAVHEVLGVPGRQTLVIDLAGVDFVDSTGVGALVAARNDAEDQDTELVLRSPSSRVRRILGVTGLLDVFTLS